MKRNIIFYLPRSASISTAFHDLLNRWQTYAHALVSTSSEVGYVEIVTDEIPPEGFDQTPLKCTYSSRFRLQQFLYLYRETKSSDSTMIISGNNFDALLISLFIRALCRNVNVQASIHMEIDAVERLSGLKGLVKKILMHLMIPRVDSLRLVRESESQKAIDLFGLQASQIVVCPVPIIQDSLIDLNDLSFTKPKSKTLGYVGRIHVERNPLLWTEIALGVLSEIEGLEIVVAGDGPLLSQMKSRLSCYSSQTTFLGNISSRDLLSVWKRLHTLLVTAPFESYGLAAREALLNGCFVVAPRIDTYLELEKLFTEGIYLYESKFEAEQIIKRLLSGALDVDEIRSLRETFLKKQDEFLHNLALSWIE